MDDLVPRVQTNTRLDAFNSTAGEVQVSADVVHGASTTLGQRERERRGFFLCYWINIARALAFGAGPFSEREIQVAAANLSPPPLPPGKRSDGIGVGTETRPAAGDRPQCYRVARGEMGTIALNNYLGKIFFLCLPRRDIVLRAFEPLTPAAAAASASAPLPPRLCKSC